MTVPWVAADRPSDIARSSDVRRLTGAHLGLQPPESEELTMSVAAEAAVPSRLKRERGGR